ncbi:MAG: putative acyl-CoA dehydrogenase [Acidimicrobiales bacterium]|nr:putative acyl-CoA dehydrogenase [Acidimicrobiales bacterium]
MVENAVGTAVSEPETSVLGSEQIRGVGSESNEPERSATRDGVLAEFRQFLAHSFEPDLSLSEWRGRLVRSGWAAPSWPTRWHGRGLPAWADDVVFDEINSRGLVGPPLGIGTALAGPTILEHGPDSNRERFLYPILTGEAIWCQLFSEPGAGSDLAAVTTRAELDGDEWVLNGQKVWNSNAAEAGFGILLARTDWDAPKHKGLTFFAVDLKQPGVVVRPLREMNHEATFNEVFLTDARIPRSAAIGRVGDGWNVALTTLAYERKFHQPERQSYHGCSGRLREEADSEANDFLTAVESWGTRAGRADLLIARAREVGRASDLAVRQELARVHCLDMASTWTAGRAIAAMQLGRMPGAEGSIGKLAASHLARMSAALHARLGGADSMLMGPDSPREGLIAQIVMSAPAQSIAGGTDEIQRNIIGEKFLGLPREPSPDRSMPFRDAVRNV